MLIFTVRRLAQAVLVLIGSTFLMYIAVFQLGDPFLTKPESEKVVSPEARAMLHAHFGLDKPFYLQYLIYLKNVFTLNFGVDFDQRRQVSELLGAAAPNTVRLAVLAIALNVLFGVLAGIASAVWHDTFIDALVTVSTIMLLCVPSFVVGLILRAKLSGLHVFGTELFPQLPPPFGVEPPWFKTVLLPAFTLGAVEIAFVARLMRASMLEVMHETYLHTARAKGLPERTVIFKHAARNALLPVVNHVGIAFGALLGGAVITETIFSYPGLGYLFIRSVANVNNPVMLAIAVLAVITFVTLSAVVDVLSAYLDPRIRVS